ncbi:MAG: hypothetical protein Q7R87_01390 [Nanoarchaeota archaeon]|nr:hypothetical protein [Nanoarchaeota archaeon]
MNYRTNFEAMPIFIYEERDFNSENDFRIVLMQGTSEHPRLKLLEGKVTGFSPKGIMFASYHEGNLKKGADNAPVKSLAPVERNRIIPYSSIGMAEQIPARN